MPPFLRSQAVVFAAQELYVPLRAIPERKRDFVAYNFYRCFNNTSYIHSPNKKVQIRTDMPNFSCRSDLHFYLIVFLVICQYLVNLLFLRHGAERTLSGGYKICCRIGKTKHLIKIFLRQRINIML